ncbi:nucleosomal histone kinase 1 [Musca autumnalis]|uniref:nucleosomal histone kinase 1 n=1 Tax=Musca autumnalis TaxID=221902 RepID=UPI003CEEC2BB
MPKVATKKAGGAKKAAAGAKKSKLYNMPEKIKEGTILTDMMKGEWKIGPSIGTGGFGEIYSACKPGENKYEYVVKCEPHDNGPLFVEMHFYMRNAKLDDVRRFQKEHGLKSFGMPYMVGNGSAEINGLKHRFIVMPRYGSDVAKHFLNNDRRLPEGTCYRLALQMLDVYEFIHGSGYVHADLKAANILLGYGPKQQHQAYLVDFGLASRFTTKDFKPDPKKMHNGTIEYTSRDAHLGVPTMRTDMEILGYNLIEWLGAELPWVRDKLLANPVKVQKSKEEFMSSIAENLKKIFPSAVPEAVLEYMKYVSKMEYNTTPDYEKCRKIFQNALKVLKFPNSGDLDFKMKSSAKNSEMPSTSKAKAATVKSNAKKTAPVESSESENEAIDASDDDDGDVVFDAKRPIKKEPKSSNLKTTRDKLTPKLTPKRNPRSTPKGTLNISPVQLNSSLKRKSLDVSKSPESSPSPKKRTKLNGSITNSAKNRSRRSPLKRSSPGGHNTSSTSSPRLRSTPMNAKASIRMSPAITMSSSRSGKTIINDKLTPNKKPTKTYEFNFELDVSMDANVIVNVKRKKKPLQPATEENAAATMSSSNRSTPLGKTNSSTPVTRVNVRKVGTGGDESPRTPAVTVKKSRRVHRSPS